MVDRRLRSAATQRNRDPILRVLRTLLPPRGLVLEVASGTGEHVAHFAPAFPDLVWQPTDRDPPARESIAAWTAEGQENVRPPLDLDVASTDWPVAAADAILAINLIHISPWTATRGLMRSAGRILPDGGVLYLYGAYRIDGRHTAPSNEEFDRWLKNQSPAWGVRDLEDVVGEARTHGLGLIETVAMPANNFSVVFRKGAAPRS
ncbi:MAG: DUF938 domain-containing protein [Rhodospirillales bacterium]|nr:DUF938 domain-containing protein [Rhodospirillales bacterium]